METPKEHPKIKNFKGKGNTKGFSAENQPAPPLKSAGWQKKKFTRTIIREFLEGKFDLSPELKKQFANKFGIDADNITVGAATMMQQAMLAMGSGTTSRQAAEFLFNQAYGQPKQTIEHEGEIRTQPEIDLSKYSDDELRTLAELQSKGRTSKA